MMIMMIHHKLQQHQQTSTYKKSIMVQKLQL